MRFLRLLLVLFLFFAKAYSNPHEYQYWQRATLTTYEDEKWRTYVYGETRIRDNPCCLNTLFFSPLMARYRVNKNLDFEAHYTFIEGRDADFIFRYRNRFEFEVNPTWELAPWLTLTIRNRYELIQTQDGDELQQRYRFRPRFTIPWKPCCWIEAYSIHNEVIYDITSREITQNRFVPVEIRMRPWGEGIVFSPFVMWEARREGGTWIHRFVLGSQIDLNQ